MVVAWEKAVTGIPNIKYVIRNYDWGQMFDSLCDFCVFVKTTMPDPLLWPD